jgi:hypothetical protein
MEQNMAITKRGSLLKRGALFVAGVAIGVLAVQWVQKLMTLDPFAAFRDADTGPLGSLVGVRMDNVSLKFYDGPTQTGACQVERVDVQKNKQFLDLYVVRDGSYTGAQGTFHFDADRAMWDANADRLLVMSGAKIRNADMNVVADPFEYNQQTKLLYVPTQIRGSIFGGNVVASSLTYSLADGSYEMGPVAWSGMAALSSQDTGEQEKKSHWKIDAKHVSRDKGGNNEIWTDGVATDGEVIVKAPKIERDRKTDVITATGKVVYYSAKTNMTCDKAVVYRKEKRAVMTGNVQMILKPTQNQKLEEVEIPPYKPEVPEDIEKNRPPAPPGKSDDEKKLDDEVRSGKTTRKYPLIILSDKIEYWYAKGSRHAIITGNPQARQDLAGGRWRYAWTHEALYDGEKETLKMVSTEGQKDTHVKTSLGDDFIADNATVSTEEDNDEVEAEGVKGDFFSSEDEIPKLAGGKDSDKTGTKSGDKGGDNGGPGAGGGDNGKPPIKGPIGGGG